MNLSNKNNKMFDVGLYRIGLRRLSSVGVAVLLLAIIITSILPVYAWMVFFDAGMAPYEDSASNISYEQTDRLPKPRVLSGFKVSPLLWCFALFGVITIFIAFSFLLHRSENDFFEAIPYKRTCVYFSFLAAALTWSTAIMLAAATAPALVYAACPYYSVELGSYLKYCVGSLIFSYMLSSFMMIAMSVSGKIFPVVMIFTFLTAYGYIVSWIYLQILREITEYFFRYDEWEIDFSLDSLPFITGDTSALICMAVLTVLFFALAYIVFKKHTAETAGASAKNKIYQTVIRVFLAFPFAFGIVYLLISEWGHIGEEEVVWLAVFAGCMLLVYFSYEIICTRSLKLMFASAKHMVWIAVCCLAVLISLFGVRALIIYPKLETDMIKDADITYSIYLPDEGYYTKRTLRTSDVEATEFIAQVYENNQLYIRNGVKCGDVPITIKVRLKCGITLNRLLYISEDDRSELPSFEGEYLDKKAK